METLPDEILIKVLTYLSPDQLVTASEVSQTFAQLSSDPSLWKTISLKENQTFLHHKKDLRTIVQNILGSIVYLSYFTRYKFFLK